MLNRTGSVRPGAVVVGLAIVIAAPSLALLTVARAPGAYTGAPTAVSYPAGTLVQPPRPVPALQLIDERGHATSLARFRGKWLVVAPAMTLCRETCPLTTALLTALSGDLRRDGLARRVDLAEITVDPWRDSPARLRAYRRLTGVDFTLLTGSPREIHRLWDFLGVFYERVPEGSPATIDWMTHRPETFDVQHTDGVFILDPAGRERIVDEGMAGPSGPLPKALRRMLDAEGRRDLAHPQSPWTAGELLADLGRLIGTRLPGPQTAANTAPASAPAHVPPLKPRGTAQTSPPRGTAQPRPPRGAAASPPRGAAAAPLRALQMIRAQAGRLLGGYGALARRLAQLRGLPVVLNAWASWCPPCRSELPILAAVARAHADQVAFLGIDVDDSGGAARSMLAAKKVSYPSYQASLGALDALAPVEGTPSTIFLDRTGQIDHIHPGQYESARALEADLDRYALGH